MVGRHGPMVASHHLCFSSWWHDSPHFMRIEEKLWFTFIESLLFDFPRITNRVSRFRTGLVIRGETKFNSVFCIWQWNASSFSVHSFRPPFCEKDWKVGGEYNLSDIIWQRERRERERGWQREPQHNEKWNWKGRSGKKVVTLPRKLLDARLLQRVWTRTAFSHGL